jgi:hypothetical protein
MPATENIPGVVQLTVSEMIAERDDLRSYVRDLEQSTLTMIRLAEERRAEHDLGQHSFTETDVYAGQLQMLTAIAGYMDNSNVTRG